MKLLAASFSILAGAGLALAQTPPTQAAPPPVIQISGSFTAGVQQLDNTTSSSKLTEYRDLGEDLYLPGLTFAGRHTRTGRFFDFSAVNLTRDDQSIVATGGRPGTWRLEAAWTEIPHNLSNKAVTPYIARAPGRFEVPDTVPITFKKLQTGADDAPGVLASDQLVAAYQATFLAPTPLRFQTNAGRFEAAWSGRDGLRLEAIFDTRTRDGAKPAFGPIGDRPPRTLNIQMIEPVDYRTNDLTLAAEHAGRRYDVRVSYAFSDFTNHIDTLEWQNVFATPDPGASFDTWDRSVSAFGRRPLAPDNRSHHLSGTVGVDLPYESRLTGTATYGRLDQNEPLLPYSFNSDVLAVQTLPRGTAEAEMSIVQLLADYVVNPVNRLTVRAWIRHYGLGNETPETQWKYVTSDTSNLNGTTSYKNSRISLAYGYDRTTAGAEGTYRLPARSALTVGYQREQIDREYRETNTGEDRFTASLRTRAARGVNVRVRYQFGSRDGDYDPFVTRQSYWYAPAASGTDNDNPQFTFSNHPDMRRFDVADRRRHQVDATVNLTPRDQVAVSAVVRYRNDDFDSDVAPAQPLLGRQLADAAAATPGDQLGLLEDARLRYGLDLFLQPNDRVTLNAFLNYDRGTNVQRSLEFNENNKQNPGAIATAELGPWTRATSQWTADTDDRTWSAGIGTTMQLRPNGPALVADYTVSLADIDIDYAGFGVTNFDGTPFPPNHPFAFSTPPTIEENLHVGRVRLDVPLGAVTLLAQYTYERYRLDDWQQGSNLPWVESVGADTFLRDTSRSHQWGNRLFNLGTFLAPDYDAHIGLVGFSYRF